LQYIPLISGSKFQSQQSIETSKSQPFLDFEETYGTKKIEEMFLGDYENCKTNLELDQERRKNEFEVSLGLKDSTRSVKIG
jgi:hypothetical protein